MSDEFLESARVPKRGQMIFAIVLVVAAALLASQLWDQTVWRKGKHLFSQARFWPAVGVFGMLGFGALHLLHLPRRKVIREDRDEALRWVLVCEYAVWFIAYVWLVPWLGYLPVTLVLAVALTWRMGYRSRGMIGAALLFGLATVLLFKTFLQVKIPGGAIYDIFPAAIRNFLILYL
ncbi:MAG: tripartite tricarboxylate transporter TctB family protein [Pelagimonas sp.]|uniref:tripartite tricarboxylate transporter TctB family protein n=1 Tax=Pelagimonas sp. TaxID=2073170 RepID=UPI003D6A1A85